MSTMSTKKKVLQQIVLVLILMVVIFSILEGAARVFGPQILPADQSKKVSHGQSLPNEPNLIGDALLGWRVKEGMSRQFGVPDLTNINSDGLRNTEVMVSKTKTRILIVGDSSIFGVRVRDSENISGQLEAMLNKSGFEVEVLNAGCPGYSSWQVYRLLKERLLKYKPDWVIVGALWSDTQGADEPDSTQYGNIPMPWRYHSRLFVMTNMYVSKKRWELEEAPEVHFGTAPVVAPTNRVPIGNYEDNLYAINDLVEENNGKTAFLLLPGRQDVQYGRLGDFREGYRAVMREVAKDLDVPIADMPSKFKDVGREREYFLDDVHPTVKGYRIIAKELTDILTPVLDKPKDK